jgi:RNA 2',3'-cyclic 3'-phosphodiesterase
VTDRRITVFDQLSMFDDSPPAPPAPPSPPTPVSTRSDGPPGLVHSLFFAVISGAPDSADLHAQAALIDRRLGVGGRALEAARLHVSLHAVGAYIDVILDADIARWCRAAATVRCAPFEVVFDRVATFGGDGNPLVLKGSDDAGVAGLLALHQALGIALANAGERIKLQRITPHMTLSYRGKRVAETAIEGVRWRAHELVLIDSHVGTHRHEVLGRWALTA